MDNYPEDPKKTEEDPEENAPEEQESEPYSFMNETVKSRPVRVRRVVYTIFGVAGAAVLFGLISGAVFHQMNSGQGSTPIVIAPDSVTASAAATASATPTLSATPSPSPTPTAEATPSPTPSATPEPTEEEKASEQVASYKELYTTMETIAEKPAKSVVTVTGITRTEDWFNTENESSRSASGIIVGNNGQSLLILTQNKVTDNVQKILTTFADGTEVEGTFQKKDPGTGLAVVNVPLASVPADTMSAIDTADFGNSYAVSRGQPVIAIGRPMGYSDAIVFGQVSSVSNRISVIDGSYSLLTTNIQGTTDGSGVLVDLDGRIVGIIMQDYSPSGGNTIAGIPISPIKTLIEKLSNNTDLCYVGIEGEDVSAQTSKSTGVPQGIYVTAVKPDSPALAAGLKSADVITELNGHTIGSMQTFGDRLAELSPGDTMKIKVMRSGADGYVPFDFTVTIGSD